MLKLLCILLSSLGMELANQATPVIKQMQRNAPSQITGVVKDVDGNPVEGVAIMLMPNYYTNTNVVTDSNGKYVINWKPANYSWVEMPMYVLARKKDSNLAGTSEITLDSKKADIDLKQGFMLRGKVINEDGDPLEGASISISLMAGNWAGNIYRGASDIKTDSDGIYEIASLPRDHRYSINITNVKGYGSANKSTQTDSGAPGTVVELENTVLMVADMAITGMVVDEDGNGLPDVNLFLYGNGQPNVNQKSDKDGKFVFDAVCAGRASIQANMQKDGQHLYNYIQTEGGAQEVVLVLGERPNYNGFVPRAPIPLLGQTLPDMAKYGIDNPESGRRVLLFFWDMKQRPSRHFIKQLAAKKEILDSKDIKVILIQNGQADRDKLNSWLNDNDIAFDTAVLGQEVDDAKFKLGLKSMPWLILTDGDLMVVAEGFSIDELETKLN